MLLMMVDAMDVFVGFVFLYATLFFFFFFFSSSSSSSSFFFLPSRSVSVSDVVVVVFSIA